MNTDELRIYLDAQLDERDRLRAAQLRLDAEIDGLTLALLDERDRLRAAQVRLDAVIDGLTLLLKASAERGDAPGSAS